MIQLQLLVLQCRSCHGWADRLKDGQCLYCHARPWSWRPALLPLPAPPAGLRLRGEPPPEARQRPEPPAGVRQAAHGPFGPYGGADGLSVRLLVLPAKEPG